MRLLGELFRLLGSLLGSKIDHPQCLKILPSPNLNSPTIFFFYHSAREACVIQSELKKISIMENNNNDNNFMQSFVKRLMKMAQVPRQWNLVGKVFDLRAQNVFKFRDRTRRRWNMRRFSAWQSGYYVKFLNADGVLLPLFNYMPLCAFESPTAQHLSFDIAFSLFI